MKKILIALISCLTVNVTFAQTNLNWVTLNTGTTKKINDIYFHTPDTGYIVGDDYLFKKTTDGGMTWVDLTAPAIGERPGNNGSIIGIEHYNSAPNFGNLQAGLYLSWEKGDHGIFTSDEGATYNRFNYDGTTQFCTISGFSILPHNRGNGYVNILTYGENCNGNAVFYNYFDGPFSIWKSDTTFSANSARFTSADVDSFALVLGHSDGYLLKYPNPFSTPDSIFLDNSGVTAIAYAGNHKWYAKTNRNSNNMYVSVDTGKTFSIDRTFTLFLNPRINEFSFLDNGIGIAATSNNMTSGAILVQKNNSWDFDLATQPLNAAQILDNGTAYVAGDSGLVMKTTIITSIKEVDNKEHQWQVYPHPTKEMIYFKGLESLAIDSIQLFDSNGRLIKSVNKQQNQIDVSDLAKGTYIVNVMVEGQTLSKKVLIK